MGSEELIAYEVGYRRQQTDSLSWDAAGFYNVYQDLLATRNVVPPVGLPVTAFFSGGSADVYGLEISSEWRVNCCWKIRAWYTYLKIRSEYDSSATQLPDNDKFGTPVNLYLDANGTIGIEVNVDAIARRGLNVDAKMLNISRVIRDKPLSP